MWVGSAWTAASGPVDEGGSWARMSPMKTTLLALCLALSACGTTPPKLAVDAPAAEVYEAWRSYAADTDRRVFVHLGAPW